MTLSEQLQEQAMAKVATLRDGIAARIKDLSQRWAENTIALGREFKRARDTFPVEGSNHRPGWRDWIANYTGWHADHATRFIRIAEKFRSTSLPSGINASLLDLMASPLTPETATKEIISRARDGQIVSLREAKGIVEEHKPRPKPKEANEKAKETGKAVLASDGNYYFGASKEDADAYEKKIKIVYTVRRAIEDLANVGMSPIGFLKYADKHQLWRADEEHLLTKAHDWLNDLLTAWEDR